MVNIISVCSIIHCVFLYLKHKIFSNINNICSYIKIRYICIQLKFIYIRFIINLILNFIYLLLFLKNKFFPHEHNLFKRLFPTIFCFQIFFVRVTNEILDSNIIRSLQLKLSLKYQKICVSKLSLFVVNNISFTCNEKCRWLYFVPVFKT